MSLLDLNLDAVTGPISTGSNQSFLAQIANRVATLLELVAYPLAIAGIVYTAYVLITSIGNPDAMKTAKKNIIYILTGIFLIIFATTIINAIRYIILK